MDRCPPEILDSIFAYACTDGGETGCALGLVSKTFREHSSRRALLSVALYGPHQIQSFAEFLSRRELKDRRVHHLYLADTPRSQIEGTVPPQDKTCKLLELPEGCFNDLVRILCAVAPGLHTLTLLLFKRYEENALDDISFPALQELTLHSSSLPPPSPVHGDTTSSLRPALRRLHVVYDYSFPRLAAASISALAPHLTHLRISRLAGALIATGDLIQGLDQMASEEPDDSAGAAQPMLPRTLERVIVQMYQQELFDGSGALQLFTAPLAYWLKDIALRDTRRRIVVARPLLWRADSYLDRSDDHNWYASVKASWTDRVLGRAGIWEVDPSHIIAIHGMDEASAGLL